MDMVGKTSDNLDMESRRQRHGSRRKPTLEFGQLVWKPQSLYLVNVLTVKCVLTEN